jgi:hypothetical protein
VPRLTPGVPVGFALLVAVLFGVALAVVALPGVVPEPAPQAARRGIRKSITRRPEPMPIRFLSDETFCIMMYPLIDQDIHCKREKICETDSFYRE